MPFLVPYVESDLDRFVKAVLLDLDAAGALADYLDERDGPTAPYASGRPSPSRGALLRRRWKKWKADRDHNSIVQRLYKEYRSDGIGDPAWICNIRAVRGVEKEISYADDSFRDYIRRIFGPKFIRR